MKGTGWRPEQLDMTDISNDQETTCKTVIRHDWSDQDNWH